jgi:hypothetical protein
MRPIRTITPPWPCRLAVAGCQRSTDQPTTSIPTPIERARSYHRPGPPDTAAGHHPTQAQARPWARDRRRPVAGRDPPAGPGALGRRRCRSPAPAAATELGLYQPVARRVGPNAYEVGTTGSEWAAKLYRAQPVRQRPGGAWVITRTTSPAGSY